LSGGVRLGRSCFARSAGLAFSDNLAHNGVMVLRGRIHNGVVAFGSEISLPEGMEVTIIVPVGPETVGGRMTAEQRRSLHEVRTEIESLPNENPGDTFSGADHDRVLYGDG
jgi:hypothetical protein